MKTRQIVERSTATQEIALPSQEPRISLGAQQAHGRASDVRADASMFGGERNHQPWRPLLDQPIHGSGQGGLCDNFRPKKT
jgi:hypothetical protein